MHRDGISGSGPDVKRSREKVSGTEYRIHRPNQARFTDLDRRFQPAAHAYVAFSSKTCAQEAQGRTRPGHHCRHSASPLMTSPPARVPSAFQVSRETPDLTNRTEPSISSRFTPPGWNELGPMNESTLPNAEDTAHAV